MLRNILIKNAAIYDTAATTFSEKTDILINDGVITRIEGNITPEKNFETVEGNELYVSSGWTDCHTHLDGFDPFLSYPALGCTRIHDAGSYGAFNYEHMHNVIARLPFPVTSYLYVGVHGVKEGELNTLDNLQTEPFLETVDKYRGEIIGAKIRIDPRVNCDTYKSLRMAKELAVHAGLPLIVHPSRTTDTLESMLEVLDKNDVYTHSYSQVAPSLFDENGEIKQCVWNAVKRGVRFDLAHGSNNFSYDIARDAINKGFITETISTDLHLRNYDRAGMDLAGVMTKAIHTGFSVERALNSVIDAPLKLLGIGDKKPAVAVGQKADLTIFTIKEGSFDLPDSRGITESCETEIKDVATVIGGSLHRSFEKAQLNEYYFSI